MGDQLAKEDRLTTVEGLQPGSITPSMSIEELAGDTFNGQETVDGGEALNDRVVAFVNDLLEKMMAPYSTDGRNLDPRTMPGPVSMAFHNLTESLSRNCVQEDDESGKTKLLAVVTYHHVVFELFYNIRKYVDEDWCIQNAEFAPAPTESDGA